MKIKSLLIGSAAALVAATGAKAADVVVVAEPEPVEYVRVCDAYGAGFFYIPGTETCLRIGGEVRYQVSTNGYRNLNDTTPYYGALAAPAPFGAAWANPGWSVHSRGRFFLDAREDTEWGTLRGFIRVDATRTDGANAVNTNKAFIEIGGFKLGWEDSAWFFSPNGGLSGYGSGSDGGMYYGYQQRHLVQYNWLGGNGTFATLSLEHDGPGNVNGANGYTPDVVVRVGVSQGWGAVWVVAGYDESFNNSVVTTVGGVPIVPFANSGGFGVNAGLHLVIPNVPGSWFRLRAFYADGDHSYSSGAPSLAPFGILAGTAGGNILGSPEWSVMASYGHQFTSNFSASVAVQYFSDLYFAGTSVSTGIDAWGGEVSLVWSPLTNLEVRTEVHYDKVDIPGADGTLSGMLRFTRFF